MHVDLDPGDVDRLLEAVDCLLGKINDSQDMPYDQKRENREPLEAVKEKLRHAAKYS